ncbi:MAG: hypothetical protein HOQ47_11910 [Streptomyces sp.]|nr:hypothetical protein [Streptomyces sp.]
MNAKLSRRARTAAAVAATAVCGAVLLPATARADEAPAPGGLRLSVSEPPATELTRGGEAATFEFTAANTGDSAVEFVPGMEGTPVSGHVPLDASMTFSADPITAPATLANVSEKYGADTALGLLHPAGEPGSSFSLPAHTTWTWRIAVGLTKDYPAADSGLTVQFRTAVGPAAHSDPIAFTTAGAPAPSAATPSATPSATPPATPAPTTAAAPAPTSDPTTADTQLAHTGTSGARSTALLAAALILFGAALAVLTLRRRTS